MPDDNLLADPRTVLLLRIALGGLMLLAGWGKVTHRSRFQQLLHEGFGVSPAPAWWMALLLPPAELLLGLLVVLGVWISAAAGLISLMVLGFAVALLRMRLLGHLALRCGCFGDADAKKPVVPMILRNLILVAAGAVIWAYPSAYWALGGGPARPAGSVSSVDGVAVILLALGVLALAALVPALSRIAAIRHQLAQLPEAPRT